MDFGSVPYFGVKRYFRHAQNTFYLVGGLPGYATNLLTGNETEEEKAKPWCVSIYNEAAGKIITTNFFDDEDGALDFLKLRLKALGAASDAKIARIKKGVNLDGENIDLEKRIKQFHTMDLDD